MAVRLAAIAALVLETVVPGGSALAAPVKAAADDGGGVVVQQRVDFARDIQPIFESHCITCHGPRRQSGGLRLDGPGFIRPADHDADEGGFVVAPGKPEASELLRRISLPHDDFDIMPSEGEPLDREQIDLITRWIAEGASWPATTEERVEPAPIEIRDLSPQELQAQETAIGRLRERGAAVGPIAANHRALAVNFASLGAEARDDDLALLEGLEPSLVWLNLSRTSITDAGAARLGRFDQLRRLHLDRTSITDRALASISRLKHLEYLNLFDSDISDAGMPPLLELTRLRVLYVWRTGVTERGVEQLRAALPAVRINTGGYALHAAARDSEAAEPTCCDIALDAGGWCEHPCCIETRERGEVCDTCNPSPSARVTESIARWVRERSGDDVD